MTYTDDQLWPYLSPSRPGWWLVSGTRGQIRRSVSTECDMRKREDDALPIVLNTLRSVDQLRRSMDDDVLVLVAEAHRRGASWAEIAGWLYRTKQTVHRQYQRRMYSCRTRELLHCDYLEATRRARVLCRQGCPEEVAESRAFLWTFRQPAGRAVPDA
ncbi:hypothetical protein [Streptomyces barkulensis]|uniref:hypothetical protein n=1 Tax=Streptomyces barkulensis TaxID=1257026 RepID=UPI000C6C8A4D|nr:hypothetical protein [Streptomyces barkulensis]